MKRRLTRLAELSGEIANHVKEVNLLIPMYDALADKAYDKAEKAMKKGPEGPLMVFWGELVDKLCCAATPARIDDAARWEALAKQVAEIMKGFEQDFATAEFAQLETNRLLKEAKKEAAKKEREAKKEAARLIKRARWSDGEITLPLVLGLAEAEKYEKPKVGTVRFSHWLRENGKVRRMTEEEVKEAGYEYEDEDVPTPAKPEGVVSAHVISGNFLDD